MAVRASLATEGIVRSGVLASTITTPGKPPELDNAGALGRSFPSPS